MATVRILAGSIEALHQYWLSLAGGTAPQRHDVDPVAIKQLLPYLYIVKFETEPFRVRYILVGTEADRWNDLSLTGRYLNEFLPVDRNNANHTLLESYRRAFETGSPVFGSYTWPTHAGYTLEVRFGLFPLRVGEQIEQCLAIEDYSDFPPEIADDGIPSQDPVKIAPSPK